jgi:hypothetical protein
VSPRKSRTVLGAVVAFSWFLLVLLFLAVWQILEFGRAAESALEQRRAVIERVKLVAEGLAHVLDVQSAKQAAQRVPRPSRSVNLRGKPRGMHFASTSSLWRTPCYACFSLRMPSDTCSPHA